MPPDRLASLLPGLMVEDVGLAVPGANLFVWSQGGTFFLGTRAQGDVLFSARLAWGPAGGRLWASVPVLQVAQGDLLSPLIGIIVAEAAAPRCGAVSLLQGYVQSLVVHLMRQVIESGAVAQGVLAGLADPRLARVLVALHDDPARDWRTVDMAARAGMSRSGFMALFSARLGEAPAAYLRRFRMERARVDLDAGARVGVVARRYGYASGDAFSRAMRAHLAAA